MGRVFTIVDIEAGRTPKQSDFTKVANHIRDFIADAPTCRAVMFGSYLKADRIDFNVRSDLDVVVVYERHHAERIRNALIEIYDHANMVVNVPLNLIPIDDVSAKNGAHFISATFMNELRHAEAHGGTIGEQGVTSMLAAPTLPAELDTKLYVARKLGQFEKALVCAKLGIPEAERYKMLERTLCSPIHAARKVLEARGIECAGLGKRAIIEVMREQESKTLADTLSRIADLDEHVTRVTEATIANPRLIASCYGPVLNAIGANVRIAHNFFWRLANAT